MLDKIKKCLIAFGVALVGVLCTLLHIKNKRIDSLQDDLKKSEASNKVNSGSVELLEKQIEAERKLDGSADSYNALVDAFNEEQK